MHFIRLHMFVEQRKGRASGSMSNATDSVPFKDWRVGHIVTGSSEDWTITQINSSDSKMHYQDCEVQLVNKAGEQRTIKGSTLQSGYKFASKGDAVDEETRGTANEPLGKYTSRTDVTPFALSTDGVREFYPRKHGAEGTRILMKDKTAYVVAETFEEVWDGIKRAHAS